MVLTRLGGEVIHHINQCRSSDTLMLRSMLLLTHPMHSISKEIQNEKVRSRSKVFG